jgi:Bifunctional DNA primase/polymerase, N-terminal
MANYVPIELSPYELRIAMIGNGYHPTPCHGKKPFLSGWQGIFATEETVRAWGGDNTGGLTKFIPALDIDILDPTAAQIVEDVARSYLQGQILVRMGQVPKRAILLRTDTPFRKTVRKLIAPDGSRHKIELLGDGQQIVIHGDHPDTGLPYAWQDGKSPANTPRGQLPPADEWGRSSICASPS